MLVVNSTVVAVVTVVPVAEGEQAAGVGVISGRQGVVATTKSTTRVATDSLVAGTATDQ